MSFLHKIRRIWMIYALLTQNYAIKIYALFLQLESANFSLLECRIFMDWCWFMFCDNNWCSLILIDADWCWLMLIDADWCWLMLMLMLILTLILWPLAVTPGVTHVGVYHRPPDGHFFISVLIICIFEMPNKREICQVGPGWQTIWRTTSMSSYWHSRSIGVMENMLIIMITWLWWFW